MVIDPIELDGEEPPIIGHSCQQLVALEYRYGGTVVDPANVIFLRFDDEWHRLYFDCGIIFWRRTSEAPRAFVAPEIDASYQTVDLTDQFAIRNSRVLGITYSAIPGGAAVELHFEGDREVTFSSSDDVTIYFSGS